MEAAVLASAFIGATSSAYQASQQKKLAEEAQQKAEEARKREEAKALKIAQDTRPEAQVISGIDFGVSGDAGSTSDFLVKKKTSFKGSGVKATGTSGLGYV